MTANSQIIVLIATRMSPLFMSSAVSPFRSIPLLVRLVLLLVLSLSIFAINFEYLAVPQNLFLAVISELFIGSLFLLSLVAAYGAILTIGRVVDLQIGFGAAGVVNPNTSGQEPLIGSIYLLGFTTLFFITGMHLEFINLLSMSFQVIPLGQLQSQFSVDLLLALFSSSFALGLLLFSPVMLVIWCIDVMFGFLSKTMPQVNIYFVTLPLKIMVGLLVAGSTFAYSGQVYHMLFNNSLSFVNRALGG